MWLCANFAVEPHIVKAEPSEHGSNRSVMQTVSSIMPPLCKRTSCACDFVPTSRLWVPPWEQSQVNMTPDAMLCERPSCKWITWKWTPCECDCALTSRSCILPWKQDLVNMATTAVLYKRSSRCAAALQADTVFMSVCTYRGCSYRFGSEAKGTMLQSNGCVSHFRERTATLHANAVRVWLGGIDVVVLQLWNHHHVVMTDLWSACVIVGKVSTTVVWVTSGLARLERQLCECSASRTPCTRVWLMKFACQVNRDCASGVIPYEMGACASMV